MTPHSKPHPSRTRRTGRVRLSMGVALGTALGLVFAGMPAFGVTGSAEVRQPTSAPGVQSTVLTASEATWVTSREPRTVLDRRNLSATSSQDRTYLRFALPSGVMPSDIASAVLTLRVANSTATKPGVVVSAERGSWKAATLTYANRPLETGARLNAEAPVSKTGKLVKMELSDLAEAASGTSLSFRISYQQHAIRSTYVRFGADAPKLTITYRAGAGAVAPPEEPKPTAEPTPTPKPTAQPTAASTPTAAPTPTTEPTPAPAPQPAPPADDSASAALPFDVPAIGSSAKKVFAHYFPPYPISFDNAEPSVDYYARNYLTVDGEGGKHLAYSGLLRDRPETRGPLRGDWRLEDFDSEIDAAIAAGVDGFMVDILTLSGGNWERTLGLTAAAAARRDGFAIIPNLDATASAAEASTKQIADALAPLLTSPAAYTLPDGRVLLSSFKAEGRSASWWKEIISALRTQHGISVAFVAVFLDSSDVNMRAFAPFTYAASNWGKRSPDSIRTATNRVGLAHDLGMKWIEPIAVQDVRHKYGIYAEGANTETIRATWERAIGNDADFAQLITWNDYSESTSFAPSENHGTAFLDLSAYYASWFKRGARPALTGDELILTHRTQSWQAAAQLPPVTLEPTLGSNKTAPRDTVEVVSILSRPATLTVRIGAKTHVVDAPSGVNAYLFPLEVGKVSVTASRSGQQFASAVSDSSVVRTPKVIDLSYHAATSRDDG